MNDPIAFDGVSPIGGDGSNLIVTDENGCPIGLLALSGHPEPTLLQLEPEPPANYWLQAPETDFLVFVKFAWEGNEALYTINDRGKTDENTDVWASAPEIYGEVSRLAGGAEKEVLSLKMLGTREPVSLISDICRKVKVMVTVYEGREQPERIVFAGRLQTIKYPTESSDGLVEVTVHGRKSLLDVVAGVPCLSTCLWTYADHNCKKVANPALAVTVTNVNVNGSPVRIRISGLSVVEAAEAGRWRRAKITVGGLTLGAVDYRQDGATTGFLSLAECPPAAWEGAAASLLEGCDKTAATCKDIHDNESEFGGYGIASPDNNPTFFTT